jgi:hypothetical protein
MAIAMLQLDLSLNFLKEEKRYSTFLADFLTALTIVFHFLDHVLSVLIYFEMTFYFMKFLILLLFFL